MKKEIVILDPFLDQAIAIAKYLKKYGNYHIIGCIDSQKRGILSRYQNHKYFDEIIEHEINKKLLDRYTIVVPTGGYSTQRYFDIAAECRVGEVIFKKENLRVSDKIDMLDLCIKIDVPVPKTYGLDEKNLNFPLFCKSKHENSTLPKVRKILRKQSDFDKLPHNDVIIQDYINYPSYFGVAFIAKEGKIITSFVQKLILSYPIRVGSGLLLKKIENETLIKHTATLLEALNYSGWGLADFIYNPKKDEYVFMEINAKFWASLEFTLLSNSEFGRLLFGLDYASKPTKYFTFINRLLVTYSWRVFRYLPEIIVSYKSKSGSWRKMIVEFLNHWGGVFKK